MVEPTRYCTAESVRPRESVVSEIVWQVLDEHWGNVPVPRRNSPSKKGCDKLTGLLAEIPILSLSLSRIGFTKSWVNAALVSRGEAIHAYACCAKLQS
jgi:hypothetical protein